MPFVRKIACEKNNDDPDGPSRCIVYQRLLIGVAKSGQKNTAEVGNTAVGNRRKQRCQEDKPDT